MPKFVSYEFSSLSNEAFAVLEKLDYSRTSTKRLCLHEDDNSDLQMMVIDIMSNSNYGMHLHQDSDEIAILIKGRLQYRFGDGSSKILEINGQQSIIIPKGVKHSVQSGEQGAQYIEIIKGPFIKKQNS